jgi:signal transduction histidine kinase
MSLTNRRILVVEDNLDDVLLLRRALQANGGNLVTHVETMQEALAFCGRSMPDVALLDLHLPDSAGLDTFHTLHNQHPGLPIVVLTGLDDETVGEHAITAGAQDWFRKDDIHPRLLLRVLNHAFQRQSMLLALQASESRAKASEAVARLNEAKAKADRNAMERMLAIVSHDLRAPLHGIRASISSLIDNREVANSGAALCDAISKEAGFLIELATNLIDVDRITHGKMPWRWDVTHPAEVIRDVATTLEPLAATAHTRIAFGEISAQPIKGDGSACRRMMTNLISNAIRHSGASTIHLSCIGDQRSANFIVSDDGRGIDPSARVRLGRPFESGDDALVRGGVGLGLAISLGIAAAHGGYLSIRSRLGKGTCIKAVLRGDLATPTSTIGAEKFQELDLG